MLEELVAPEMNSDPRTIGKTSLPRYIAKSRLEVLSRVLSCVRSCKQRPASTSEEFATVL